jgi:hypothetical protein
MTARVRLKIHAPGGGAPPVCVANTENTRAGSLRWWWRQRQRSAGGGAGGGRRRAKQ